eukprot:15342031-Ditylum_brightwellii.AAC.1
MINAESREVWNSTYAAATAVTFAHPQRQSVLDSIYENPRDLLMENRIILALQLTWIRKVEEMTKKQSRKRFKSSKAGQKGHIENETKKRADVNVEVMLKYHGVKGVNAQEGKNGLYNETTLSENVFGNDNDSTCDIVQVNSGLSTCSSGGLSTCYSGESLGVEDN